MIPEPRYNYDTEMVAGRYLIKIDNRLHYGCWEQDGEDGGGLWFVGKRLDDFDGTHFLPEGVAKALRANGYKVSDDCLLSSAQEYLAELARSPHQSPPPDSTGASD